jgi:hypothetical protein
MLTKKALTALAASSLLTLLALSPVHAESIPAEEAQQLTNSAAPDVDPGASKGTDKSIVVQERMQLNNSAGPNVASRSEKGGETLPEMEQGGLR